MDEADDDYPGPPVTSGQRAQGQRQQMQFSPYNSPQQQQRQHPQHGGSFNDPLSSQMQAAMEMEQEIYLRRQLELQRDIQIRRRLLHEQHQQLMSEIDHQQQLQQLQHQSPLLRQQRLLEMEQFPSTQQQLRLQEEQLFLQQQQQNLLRQRQQLQQQMRPQSNIASSGSPSLRPQLDRTSSGSPSLRPKGNASSSTASPSLRPQVKLASTGSPSRRDVNVARNREADPVLGEPRDDSLKRKRQRQDQPQRDDEGESSNKRVQAEKKTQARKDKTGGLLAALSRLQQEEIQRDEQSIEENEASQDMARKKKSVVEHHDHRPCQKTPEDGKMAGSDNPHTNSASQILLATDEKKAQSQSTVSEAASSTTGVEKDGGKSLSDVEGTDEGHKADNKRNEAIIENGNGTSFQSENFTDKSADDSVTVAALIANLHKAPLPQASTGHVVAASGHQTEKKDRTKHEAHSVALPGFLSLLPQLPVEPEYNEEDDEKGVSFEMGQDVQGEAGVGSSGASASSQGDFLARAQPQGVGTNGRNQRDMKEASVLSRSKASSPKAAEYTTPVDTWWPSNNTIRRERRIRGEKGYDDESDEHVNMVEGETHCAGASSALRDRLANEVEPGVLEKLPHCKIHRIRTKQQKAGSNAEPLFCWQVTENYCNDIMVCCSVCSTWRHAFCGGHYKRYTIQSNLNAETAFSPTCDRCYDEKHFLRDYPKAQARIERQRTEHLRRTLATTAVIRHASFAKHGGTYKWPLGSVSATHIGGHTRSVHARHERSEKQWSEMAVKLGNGLGYRPKERVKVRTRELERLLVSVEDAEGITDRHNMILFLQNDTKKQHPAGFEIPRCNFFDPEEDEVDDDDEKARLLCENGAHDLSEMTEGKKESGMGEDARGTKIPGAAAGSGGSGSDSSSSESDVDEGSTGTSVTEEAAVEKPDESGELSVPEAAKTVPRTSQGPKQEVSAPQNSASKDGKKEDSASKLDSEEKRKPIASRCARQECTRKPRFDSLFCSDSCGVLALELDLLRSFEYGSDIHPSLLRS